MHNPFLGIGNKLIMWSSFTLCVCFFKDWFMYLEIRATEKGGERGEIFCLLVNFPGGHNGWGWSRTKPGSRNPELHQGSPLWLAMVFLLIVQYISKGWIRRESLEDNQCPSEMLTSQGVASPAIPQCQVGFLNSESNFCLIQSLPIILSIWDHFFC